MGFDLHVGLFDIAKYRQRVEPALKNYFATGDRTDILCLLEEAKQFSAHPSDLIQSSINILQGTEFYGPSVNHIPPSPEATTNRQDLDYYVRFTVVEELLEGLCLAKFDRHSAEQNMGRSALIPYLYKHSSWIENAFTGEILDTGTRLDFPLGEHAEIMSLETVETLLSELNSIPAPDPNSMAEVEVQFSNLRQILEIAAGDPDRVALLYLV
jgi:hypothetical protein